MAKFEEQARLDVCLGHHQYPIIIGNDCLELVPSCIASKQVLIVTNQTIAPLYLQKLKAQLISYQCDEVILEDGEAFKNQQSLSAIYEALIQNKHHRDTTIIALGGGVICDMAGFAAATYQRGVNLIHIPTTLLAQVDAAIGGKTAINHPLAKNMIGSFYQPKAVFIDLNTLTSLPQREFRAGLGEVIKYALLSGGAFYNTLQLSLKEGLTARSQALPWLIEHSCRIKKFYVETDEKENGIRAHLNLGHTFAHALESYTHYQKWLHGEAVAIGLYCAALLSYKMQLIDKILVLEVQHMLQYAGLPYQIPKDIELEKLIALMQLDKKIKEDRLPFIVIKAAGDCCLHQGVTEDHLYDTLITAQEGE